MNIIKQIVKDTPYGEQTIKMIVKTVGERGYPGPAGKDGAIQYTAGTGISISDQNVISATGGGGTSYTAGDGIRISEDNVISARIYPPIYFYYPSGIAPYPYERYYREQWPWIKTPDDVRPGRLWLTIHGALEGSGNPTPTSPQTIKAVGGTQRLVVGYNDEDPESGNPTPGGPTLEENLDFGALELYGFPYYDPDFDGGYWEFYDTDYIHRDDSGNWYIRKRTNKVVLDGSDDETWAADGLSFYVTLSDKEPTDLGLCSHFELADGFVPDDPAYRGKCAGSVYEAADTSFYFMPADASQTTLASFKAWLAQNPITLYYPISSLATPTDIQITDATLIASLEELFNAEFEMPYGSYVDVEMLNGSEATNIKLGLNIRGKDVKRMTSDYDIANLTWGYMAIERDTGTAWLDGKEIYKKTVAIGSLPNNTTSTTSHGISHLCRIVKLEGIAMNDDNGYAISLPYSTTTSCIMLTANLANISVTTDAYWSDYNAFITIYYTKDNE